MSAWLYNNNIFNNPFILRELANLRNRFLAFVSMIYYDGISCVLIAELGNVISSVAPF